MGKGADPTAGTAQETPLKNGCKGAEEGELLPEVKIQMKQETPSSTIAKIITGLKKNPHTARLVLIVVLFIIIISLSVTIGVLQRHLTSCQLKPTKDTTSNPDPVINTPKPLPCADGWIWYQNKCYLFSEDEGTWAFANDKCASLDSSLAKIDNEQEMKVFLMNYMTEKDYWIGLKNDSNGLWKWRDGTKIEDWLTVKDYSDCAYRNHDSIRSAECTLPQNFICTKISNYETKQRKRSLTVQHFY